MATQKVVSSDSWYVVVGAAVLGVAVGCWLRGRHNAKRQVVGGFRCEDCKRAFGSLDEAGALEDASVKVKE